MRVEYNRVVDQTGAEEADAGQIVPVLTGTNVGAVRLRLAGLYLVEASVNLLPSTAPSSAVVWDYTLNLRINGTTRKIADSLPTQGIGGGCVSIIGLVRITRAQLADTIYPDEARLEIFVQHSNGGPADVVSSDTNTSTTSNIAFLG